MSGFFQFLQNNPYLLLFLVVGLAVWIGRMSFKGYGLGMVAGAIVVGAGISVWASTYGAKLELNNFAKSLFYYLFMYGVGLRVGPSFINSLKGDGLKFSILAVVSCVLGLAHCRVGRQAVRSAPGRGRRHTCRLADHVGRDRLCRAGRIRHPTSGRRHTAGCGRPWSPCRTASPTFGERSASSSSASTCRAGGASMPRLLQRNTRPSSASPM